jgi:hypothetical protein
MRWLFILATAAECKRLLKAAGMIDERAWSIQVIKHNPQKYLNNTSGGVQASTSQPPDPRPLKSFS